MRHIFAHGHLTAHPNGSKPDDLKAICGAFSDFFLDPMRYDFRRRVDFALAMLQRQWGKPASPAE